MHQGSTPGLCVWYSYDEKRNWWIGSILVSPHVVDRFAFLSFLLFFSSSDACIIWTHHGLLVGRSDNRTQKTFCCVLTCRVSIYVKKQWYIYVYTTMYLHWFSFNEVKSMLSHESGVVVQLETPIFFQLLQAPEDLPPSVRSPQSAPHATTRILQSLQCHLAAMFGLNYVLKQSLP